MTIVDRNGQPRDLPAGVRDASGNPTWGSDLVLDILRQLGIEYAAILPGSTFRGLHDSAVNYTANRAPELILCNHEMITVAMARGYARATGKPMVAIVHNLVGLLNASMTIYDAWVDRVPVVVLGGTGPVDASQRRPWIDWIHTANVQGNAVRDFTKWDDQPSSLAAIPESLLRAYRIAMTEPRGPVYVNFDVSLQEQELPADQPISLPNVARYAPPAAFEPDRAALRQAAQWLVSANFPLAFADAVGRSPEAVRVLVEFAELLAMPVVDLGDRHSFPTPHALDFAGDQQGLLRAADVVLGLDVRDLEGALRVRGEKRRLVDRPHARGPRVVSISVDELLHRGFAGDYQALPAVDLPMLADTALALPRLLEAVQALLASDVAAQERITRRRTSLEPRQAALRARQQKRVQEQWDRPQISETRLAAEVWEVVKGEPYVFTVARLRRMAPGVCTISGPEQHVGGGGGGAVGAAPGVALGAALGLKHQGKLPVAILGDGELLSSIQVLWTAAHYHIPSLWVVNNNRSYYNDEDHQERIAVIRDRPPENKWVAMRLEDPAVDFAAIARTFGLHGEGPIKNAEDLGPALRRALDAVKAGKLAVVDVWTENRASREG